MRFFIIYIFTFVNTTALLAFEKNLEAEVNIGLGHSSNPANIPEESEVSGSFYNINPTLSYKKSLTQKLWGYGVVGANFLKYNDEILKENLNQNIYNVSLGALYFLNQHHEVGLGGSLTSIDGSTINPFNTGGFPFKRDLRNIRAYYRYNGNENAFEISLEGMGNNAKTVIFDEAGNQFEDDSKVASLGLKFERYLDEKTKIIFFYSRNSTEYEGKVAREKDGTIDSTQTNPFLKSDMNGFSLSFDKEASMFDVLVALNYQKSKDKVFEAENFNSIGFSGKFDYKFDSKTKFSLSYSQAKTTYDNFVALLDITSMDQTKREDSSRSFSLGAEREITENIELSLSYANTQVDSNYRTSTSELAKFSENIFSLGAKLTF